MAHADATGPESSASLKSYMGLSREQAQLFTGGAARTRALRRLARAPSAQAFEAARVVDVWLETQPVLALDERLELARALAPLAGQGAARRRLGEVVTAAGEPTAATSPQARMARQVAALGLARSGDAASLELLGEWLRREPETAKLAAHALRAYPPREIEALLTAAGPTTPLLLDTLGELGDVRAYEFLSRTLKRATPEIQAHAALALARLGVRETVPVAEYWLKSKGVALELLTAATRILLHFDDERAPKAFSSLLARSPTLALHVAIEHPSESVTELGAHFDAFEDQESQVALLGVLAKGGSGGIAHVVDAFLTRPNLRSHAAFVLAHSSEPRAHRALRLAVKRPPWRSVAMRALILSEIYGGNVVTDLEQQLDRLVREGNPSERAIARFGIAVRSETRAMQMLASDDVSELEAAGAVLWWHSEEYRQACADRLARLSSRPLSKQALALSPALSAPSAARTVPVSLLVAWIHSGMPVALPAGWQLATRALPAYEPLVARLLQSADHELRAAAYLGLGLNASPKYTGILARALRTELNADVRLSIAAALRVRNPLPASEAVLAYASLYDPSLAVRQWLLMGPEKTNRPEAVWVDVEQGDGSTHQIVLSSPVRSPIALQVSESSAATLVGVDDTELSFRIVHQPITKP